MKRILVLFLLLALPVVLPAQQAAPELSLSMSGVGTNLYAGWPLIVNVTIMNSTRLAQNSAPLVIAPPNALWTDTITFTVLSASGQTVQWPLKLVGTPADPSLTLMKGSYVRASWQISPTDSSALPAGDYLLIATVQVSGSTGWNGAVQSSPLSITVGPEPALTDALQTQKTFRFSEFAFNTDDIVTAVTVTQQLRLAQPDNAIAAIVAANVLNLAGYTGLALLQGSDALNTYYRVNPTALEAPSTLLATYQDLFATMATPGTAASTFTSASSSSLVFSSTDQALTLSATISASGSVDGGTVTFTIAGVGSSTSSPVTSGSATAVLTVPGGTHAGSYLIQAVYSGTSAFTGSSDSTASLTIARATPVISWNTPTDIAPGTPLGPNQLNATANVPGSFLYSPPAGTLLAPGTSQPLSVSFTPADAIDFNSASAAVSINVTKAQLTITANSVSRQYGQANPLFTASFSGFVNGDTASVLSGALSCSSTAAPLSPVSGGPYPITCSGLTSTSYTISFVSGTLTINPAPLTVVANNTSVQYGRVILLNGASYSGFVNGDTATALAGTLNCTTPATPSSSVGTYTIVCSGVASTNYTISFAPGLLTITPAPLTITANDAARAYGAANPPLNTVTASGFANGDTLSSLTGTLACTTVATPTSPAGAYPILCMGLSSPNYSITYLPGTLTIKSDTLTVTAINAVRQYGSANPSFAASFAGFVNGDTPASLGGSLACATTATPASSVSGGPYPINCSGLNSASYAINYVPGALTISPAPLVVAANGASRPYGANNPAFTGTITGLLNSDTLVATFATSATPASPLGTYPILPALAAAPSVLSSYTISLLNGALQIVPEGTSLSLAISPASIGVNQSSTVTITLTAPDMVIPIDPTVLAAVTLSSPVSTDVLTDNGVCTPLPGAAPGVAACSITVTPVEPNGRTLTASFPGTPALAASTASASLMVTTPVTGITSCIASDFRNIPVRGGDYLWFNSIFRVRNVRREKITLSFSQSTVDFHYLDASNQIVSVHQSVPDAKVIVDPSVRVASNSFDAAHNIWITSIPFDTDDNAFLSGFPWQVPAGGIPGDIQPVTWCGTFSTDKAGVEVGWRWAAAAYSHFSNQNGSLGAKAMDGDRDYPARDQDPAATPENFKRFVIPGARGFGGVNYTGTYSRSKEID